MIKAPLTPIEGKLYVALQDREYHSSKSLQLTVVGKRFAAPSLVPTHIGRLRKKLDQQTIEHVPGRGYRLVETGNVQ